MSQMKKLSLIVSHTDIVNVLNELIEMECVEPTEPSVTLDPPELTDLLNREEMELEAYDANYESIILLATQYTYLLMGWVPALFESQLSDTLSKYICAWEITDITNQESDDAPIMLKYPQLFGKMRSGGRRIFTPLSKAHVY